MMTHLDAETISLLALGEQESNARLHVRECEDCSRELATMQRVVRAGRSLTAEDLQPPAPPPLWGAIAAELGLEDRSEPTAGPVAAATAAGSPRVREPAGGAGDGDRGGATVLAPRGGWTRRPAALLAAAACLVLLAVAVVVTVDREPADGVVAAAQLEPLDPAAATVGGTAELIRDGDELALRVDLEDLPDVDGYYELWLLGDEGARLVSLGPLSDRGVYPLPRGLSPDEFPVVDVSQEAFDGDPTHSGLSRFRGDLVL